MDNAELINELQTYIREIEDDPVNTLRLMWRAADALEAAEKRIAELNTKCADLQSQINSMENEIEELLPKEGKWISTYDGFEYDVHCSVCGEEALIKEGGSHDHVYSRYCPNCGARMKGEQE